MGSRAASIDFKLAVLVYRCLLGMVPRYLSDHIQIVADSNRRRLRSSSSMQLAIRRTRLSTVGDRAFPVVPPLEQSASSNAHRFPESPQDTTLLEIISCITLNCFSVPTSYTVDSSGLAVFT